MREFRLVIDPRNPGQYFACCGLLELANLITPESEARFDNNGTSFVLYTDVSIPACFTLLERRGFQGKSYNETLEPLEIILEGRQFTLNWWLNETLTGKSPFKTWGGQQTPRRLLSELLRLLSYSEPFDSLFGATVYTTSRFGVDARSAWDAIDAGYSPNDIGQAALTSAWVEVLAVIGLQGFRPSPQGRARYRYSTWGVALPASTARAACPAPWPGLPTTSFQFSIANRGQGYKTFLFAEQI